MSTMEGRAGAHPTTPDPQLPIVLAMGCAALAISVVGDEFLHFVYLVATVDGVRQVSIGIVGFLILAPSMFGAAVGGWLRRHWASAHRILLASIGASAVVCAGLWTAWPGRWMLPMTYFTCFSLGTLGVVITTIWQSALPEIARPGSGLKRAVGWTTITLTVGVAAGPFLAAALTPVLSQRDMILLDAVSFLAAVALMWPAARLLRHSRPKNAEGATSRHHSRGAVRLVLQAPLVRSPALSLMAMNFVTAAVMFGTPVLVTVRGLPLHHIAWASGVGVAASLAGSSLSTFLRTERLAHTLLTCEPAMRAAGIAVLALDPSSRGLYLGVFLFSLPQGFSRVIRLSYLLSSFEGADRPAAVGAYRMLIRGALPIAPLVMEPVVGLFGVKPFFLLCVVLLLASTFVLLSDRDLRAHARARQEKGTVES